MVGRQVTNFFLFVYLDFLISLQYELKTDLTGYATKIRDHITDMYNSVAKIWHTIPDVCYNFDYVQLNPQFGVFISRLLQYKNVSSGH